MARRQGDGSPSGSRRLWALLFVILTICLFTYVSFSPALWGPRATTTTESSANKKEEGKEQCCRGVEGLELWGPAVKWGSDHRLSSAAECCAACKAMCPAKDGTCKCDSWVFCADKDRCGNKFGECWLKKQTDVMIPSVAKRGEDVIWTSGLIYGKGEGFIGLETSHGTLRIKLLPDCAPHSVAYISEILALRHCPGCRFYRAEDRGNSWDANGDHITNAPFGPPYALLQGTLEADGLSFRNIPMEACPPIKRGSVAWVGSGPEFFISLANHQEWKHAYTVFGSVLPEDMEIAEKIVLLPKKPDIWSNITVAVLKDYIEFKLKRISSSKVS